MFYWHFLYCQDEAIDESEHFRLTNLQSLQQSKDKRNSPVHKPINEPSKISEPTLIAEGQNHQDNNEDSILTSPEDETECVDELPLFVSQQPTTENYLAKRTLMQEENESDLPIKEEPTCYEQILDAKLSKRKPSSKAKKIPENEKHEEPLMLTADKMMNKELTVLHTPIVMNDSISRSLTKKSSLKIYSKNISKTSGNKEQIKTEDDSASEEEKQWVTAKKRRSKRLEKKQEDARIEDAKRAKRVSEFIEKRGTREVRKRAVRGRRLRSRHNFMERQKQLSVLSKELFGEFSGESPHHGKNFSQTLGKGRRNIRKVIDKKSLARSTVLANVEESERKRRLLMRQTSLRELLGCEEGVNVLVINDEVCLEYDFQKLCPMVTVHRFFTKVMKVHQYEGVKFMWDACFESLEKIESGHLGGGCILAHCMGLGKTLQVLALLHTVLTHPRVGMQRVLVCCPLSTVLNWVDEIHKWIGPVTDKIKVFELSKLKKTYERAYQLEDWYNGGGIFIIGYELFRNLTTLDPELDHIRPTIVNKIRKALLNPGPDIVICDEGHLLKNDSSVLAVSMSRVATKRRIILTGTPMQNNLREYYCMVNFVKPNLLGSYSEYSNRFENPIMNGQHRDSREEDIKLMKARTYILHKVLEGCLQRQEASVLYPYLPKKHEYTVFIPLTKCQSDLYKHYLAHYAKQAKAKQSILRDFHILQKIWTHPQVLHNFQIKSREDSVSSVRVEKLEDDLAHEDLTATEDKKPGQTDIWWLQYLERGNMLNSLESSNKFVTVFSILHECVTLGDKVLIFSTSLFTLDALEYFLKRINNWSLGKEYYRLDGSVPAEVRQKWCREFNAEINNTTKLFLISTRAGCLGLNMTAANRVIILDTSWNPAHDIQSIFRVYRFGQRKDCYIYRLVAMGTMEQKIYERAVTKQAVACRVVDEQQIDRHYNMDELTELYNLDESGSGVAGGVAAGVTDVALLRVARDAALHAVHEHDSLLRGSAEQQLPEHERAAAWLQFEQEQAHTQMKNLGTNSFQVLSNSPHRHEYAKPPNQVLSNIENENNDKLDKEHDKCKSNKVRKNSSKNQISNDQPSTSKQNDSVNANKESIIIEKIKAILIQHHFQNQQDIGITNLLNNVQKIVQSGLKGGSCDTNDDLTSLAKVLLQSEDTKFDNDLVSFTGMIKDETLVEPNLLANKIVEHNLENNSNVENTTNTKKQRKRKPIFDDKKETPSSPSNDSYITRSKKHQKMAAINAKKHLDMSYDDDNSNLAIKKSKRVLNRNVPEIVSDKREKTQPEPNSHAEPQQLEKDIWVEKSIKKENVEQNNAQEKVLDVPDQDTRSNNEGNCILLSDDDEVIEREVDAKTQLAAEKAQDDKEIDDDEPEPLHTAILTNPNFIKIVAHTYLDGNEMLDVDAALLAAQYSTQKLLKEVQMTGKEICSGPIYDIAVKAIPKAIMKKLNVSCKMIDKSMIDKPKETPLKQAQLKKDESVIGIPKNYQPKVDRGESSQFKSTKAVMDDIPKSDQSKVGKGESSQFKAETSVTDGIHKSDQSQVDKGNSSQSKKTEMVDTPKNNRTKVYRDCEDLASQSKAVTPQVDQDVKKVGKPDTIRRSVHAEQRPNSSDSEDDLVFISEISTSCEKSKSETSAKTKHTDYTATQLQTNLKDNEEKVIHNNSRGHVLLTSKYTDSTKQHLILPEQHSPRVVPIGMFRRTTNSPSLQATIPDDECILPDSQDNDNEEISPDPATSTSRISNHLGSLNFFVSKATKKSCPKNELENKQSTSKLTTPIVNSNVIANGSPDHTDLQAVTKTAMSTSDLECHTICILSDDDDDDTNLITPDVVPLSQKAKEHPTVSNTAAPTQQAKSSSANLGTSVNQQKPAIVPLRNSKEITNVPSDNKKAIAMSSYRKRLFNITYENDKKDGKGGQTVSLNDKTKISNSNLPKRLCQPGDIIRVNSKGEIFVVSMKNTPVKSNSNENNKLTKEKPIQNNSQIPTPTKNLFNVDRKKETNEMHVFENLKMQHQKEATTSTSTDPRALLKNVVKIQSDVYENKQNTQPSKTLPVNQTRKVNTLPVVKLNNNSNAKSHHATPLNNKPELITSKKEFPNQKLLVETIQNLKVPIQTKRATINSIDLTNYHTEESPKDKITIVGRNSEIKNKHALIMPHKGVAKIGLSATVVGSPKEILFCRTADKSSFMTSVDLTANPGYSNAAAAASSAKSSSVNIKKPSMSKDEMIIAKKKVKPNVSDPKLLTLKDFDIIDIDDIVELE